MVGGSNQFFKNAPIIQITAFVTNNSLFTKSWDVHCLSGYSTNWELVDGKFEQLFKVWISRAYWDQTRGWASGKYGSGLLTLIIITWAIYSMHSNSYVRCDTVKKPLLRDVPWLYCLPMRIYISKIITMNYVKLRTIHIAYNMLILFITNS